jgi:hypothetical protein
VNPILKKGLFNYAHLKIAEEIALQPQVYVAACANIEFKPQVFILPNSLSSEKNAGGNKRIIPNAA